MNTDKETRLFGPRKRREAARRLCVAGGQNREPAVAAAEASGSVEDLADNRSHKLLGSLSRECPSRK